MFSLHTGSSQRLGAEALENLGWMRRCQDCGLVCRPMKNNLEFNLFQRSYAPQWQTAMPNPKSRITIAIGIDVSPVLLPVYWCAAGCFCLLVVSLLFFWVDEPRLMCNQLEVEVQETCSGISVTGKSRRALIRWHFRYPATWADLVPNFCLGAKV